MENRMVVAKTSHGTRVVVAKTSEGIRVVFLYSVCPEESANQRVTPRQLDESRPVAEEQIDKGVLIFSILPEPPLVVVEDFPKTAEE